MAQANNNAKVKAEAEARAKAEAEREVRREQARIKAAAKAEVERLRKKNENEKKKSTMKPLTRNTLVRNLANLKEPALDPLRDAIMSLSDPSFLNKKFNEEVYRGLPLRVKDFIGLSANQVTRAVIISKIIEAVKIGRERNAKAKNVNFNRGIAKALANMAPKNNKPGVATTSTGTGTNRAWKFNKKTPATTPTGKNKGQGNIGTTKPKPSGTPVAATTPPTGRNNGKGNTGTPENNGLEVIDAEILPPSRVNQGNSNATQLQLKLPNTNQKIVINANAKQLQLTLPNNINPENVIESTVELLKGVPAAKGFTDALQIQNNSNSVNIKIANPNAPTPKIMAKIFRNIVFGTDVPRPHILYLEKGLVKIEEEAKKNENQPLVLKWETITKPSLTLSNGKTNVSIVKWLGVSERSPANAVAPKKSGYFSRALALLSASVAAVLAAKRINLGTVNQGFQQGSGEN